MYMRSGRIIKDLGGKETHKVESAGWKENFGYFFAKRKESYGEDKRQP